MTKEELFTTGDAVARAPTDAALREHLRVVAAKTPVDMLLDIADAYPAEDAPVEILCGEVLRRDPDNERAWELLTRTLGLVDGPMVEERTESAISNLLRVNPTNARGLRARMAQAFSRNDTKREKEFAQALMRAHPLNMDGWAAYARRIASEGRVGEGLALLDAYIDRVRGSSIEGGEAYIEHAVQRKHQITSGKVYEGVWP